MIPPSLDREYSKFDTGCQAQYKRKNGIISDGNVSLDLNYLPLSGGTMIGDVILPGPEGENNRAATKGYVDSMLG